MYPTDLPTPTDVYRGDSHADVCPDCGSAWHTPDGMAHGADPDTSLSGLLCTVALAARELVGLGDEAMTPEAWGHTLALALDRFRGQATSHGTTWDGPRG